MCLPSVAATSGETAKASNGVPQRNSRRKHIGRRQKRNLLAPHVPPAYEDRQNQPARKHSTGPQRLHAEDTSGLGHVVAPVHHQHEQLRAQNAAEGRQCRPGSTSGLGQGRESEPGGRSLQVPWSYPPRPGSRKWAGQKSRYEKGVGTRLYCRWRGGQSGRSDQQIAKTMARIAIQKNLHDKSIAPARVAVWGGVAVNPIHQVGALRGPLGRSNWGSAHRTNCRVGHPY